MAIDGNLSNVAIYTTDQPEIVSRSSPDLVGVPSIYMPLNRTDENHSNNQSPHYNNTTVSDIVMANLTELDPTLMNNKTTLSIEKIELELPMEYSQKIPSPMYQDWFKEGNTYYDEGDYEKSIACYEQAIQLNQQFSGAWCNKGMVLCRLEKYQEAIKAFDKALELDPGYEKASKGKDEALLAIGRENK